MRLGATVGGCKSPEEQADKAVGLGYKAIVVDEALAAAPADARRYADVLRARGIALAEVGAWSNPLSSVAEERSRALELCKRRLGLAEELGARCTVNISGSRGARWDGPDAKNLTPETFDMVVASVREIIDAVRPTRTFYTLETMPWMVPDSADSYVALLRAIDRKAFAVHFDPVNLVSSPQKVFANAELMRDFVAKLGPRIKSVHVKDVAIRDDLTVHIEERRPGLGVLDHRALFSELSRLDPETTVLLEHLPDEEYPPAAEHLRSVARSVGVVL
jgi:sugar phosphate isomerase/epimerase